MGLSSLLRQTRHFSHLLLPRYLLQDWGSSCSGRRVGTPSGRGSLDAVMGLTSGWGKEGGVGILSMSRGPGLDLMALGGRREVSAAVKMKAALTRVLQRGTPEVSRRRGSGKEGGGCPARWSEEVALRPHSWGPTSRLLRPSPNAPAPPHVSLPPPSKSFLILLLLPASQRALG